MTGYVHIHRSLLGHSAFRNDAEAMAFAWLVARAAWKPIRVRYRDRGIALGRGQLALSVRDFAAAMDRDKGWVERLLKRLKSETMIETHSETGVLVITICKYDAFQGSSAASETPRKTLGNTRARQGRDTEQVREEVNSVANATGDAAADPIKQVFDAGVALLTAAGHDEREARRLIGKWRKGRSDGDVLTALIDCRARAVSNPVEWLQKRFGGVKFVSASGYEYRGSLTEIIREAERRADWNTFHAARRERDEAPPPKRRKTAAPSVDPAVASLVSQTTQSLRVAAGGG